MKTIISAVIFSLFTLALIAKDKTPSVSHPEKYCTRMKGGEIKVMREEKELTSDVTLADGSKIKPNGTVIRKDGTEISLKEGECVDKNGKIMEENPKNKTEKKK